MRFGILVSLLLIAIVATACGGSDDKKGGLLSGLKDTDKGQTTGANNPGGPAGAAPNPQAIATTVAQLSVPGSGNLPNIQGLTQDPKALATAIALLSSDNLTNLLSGNQDPKALATVIAGLTGATGGIPGSAGIPTGNSSATPDPCTLLTLDDAMTVLKSKDIEKDKDSATANVMGSRDCSYIGTGSNSNSISLTVIATAGMAPQMRQSGYNAKKQFDELKRLTKDAVAVKGIRDDAWLNGARFIHVLKKDVTFDILVFMDGDATETLKAAATRVAAKLP
jgi:hypothetical protein